MHKTVKSNLHSMLMGLLVALIVGHAAWADFTWDGDCSLYWGDCCNTGSVELPEWRNNWTIAPNSDTCPDLPGPDDHVTAVKTVIMQEPFVAPAVKSLTVTSTIDHAAHFTAYNQIHIADFFLLSGNFIQPATYILKNGQAAATINLQSPKATATISSFATLDFQFDGSIYGSPTALLTNYGLILKSVGGEEPPPYESLSALHMPWENNGTITATDGKLVFLQGGTNNGIIEAYGEAEIRFLGPADFLLDGEVRGDGLIRFASTFSGGAATITGDYHPTNTLVAGGYATVNFDVNTSLENITIGNTGQIGGPANLTIDDLLWNGGYSTMMPGGTTTVKDTMLIQHDSFAGGHYTIQRDLDLDGQSILDTNVTLYMNNAELRNNGDLQLHGSTTIAQSGGTPNSVIQNFGTIHRNGGGAQSLTNVTFLNLGEVAVESGDLNFDAEMTSDGPITVNAGATLLLGHKQQTNHLSGSITGEGTVYFYNDFYSADETVDSMLGVYDVGSTTIQAGSASFDTDGIIATQKTTGTLNLIQGFGATKLLGNADLIVTDQFNWSSGEMAGTGTTFVHGPMILPFVGYWQSLSRTLELNVDAPIGPQPPTSTLAINPQGTLRCNDVTIDGHVNNNGLISPGTPTAPVGQLHLTGNYTQTAGGQLTLNKLGPAHDQLIVDGLATLNGTLNASGFPVSGGQSFTILTAADVAGTFAQVNLPIGMEITYTPTSVIVGVPGTPCPADLNGSGAVNGIDLALLLGAWTGAATYSPCPPFVNADLNDDCKVNGLDLALLLGAWGPCP